MMTSNFSLPLNDIHDCPRVFGRAVLRLICNLYAEAAGRDGVDLIVTAGFYGLISYLLNTACTQLEPGEVQLPPRPFDK